MQKLISRKEAAALLGISVSTLDSGGCGTEKLLQVRMGRRVAYRLADIEKFIQQCLRLPFSPVLPKSAMRSNRFKVVGGQR